MDKNYVVFNGDISEAQESRASIKGIRRAARAHDIPLRFHISKIENLGAVPLRDSIIFPDNTPEEYKDRVYNILMYGDLTEEDK